MHRADKLRHQHLGLMHRIVARLPHLGGEVADDREKGRGHLCSTGVARLQCRTSTVEALQPVGEALHDLTRHRRRQSLLLAACVPANGGMFEPSEAWRSTWRSDLLLVGRGAIRASSKPRPRRLAECQSRRAQRLESHNKHLQWLIAAQSPGAVPGAFPLLPLGGERNSTDHHLDEVRDAPCKSRCALR